MSCGRQGRPRRSVVVPAGRPVPVGHSGRMPLLPAPSPAPAPPPSVGLAAPGASREWNRGICPPGLACSSQRAVPRVRARSRRRSPPSLRLTRLRRLGGPRWAHPFPAGDFLIRLRTLFSFKELESKATGGVPGPAPAPRGRPVLCPGLRGLGTRPLAGNSDSADPLVCTGRAVGAAAPRPRPLAVLTRCAEGSPGWPTSLRLTPSAASCAARVAVASRQPRLLASRRNPAASSCVPTFWFPPL